ncbi:MAG TPA: hypothetical protein VIV11_20205 [Kofleriaceae bacterium]
MRWPFALPFLATLLAVEPAWALQPATHRQLAEAACSDAGLPTAFCRRMGKANFESDYHEWEELAAHAQRELGQDRCTAADAALARVDRLARETVTHVKAGNHEAGAVALGRALHTLQDECAHRGMTNEEHAFYSLTQTCTHEDVSPDVQPEAIACADRRSREVFALVATALAGTSWTDVAWICRDAQNEDSCQSATLPGPWTACEFLAQHDEWDGEDSRWNSDRVGAALVAAFGAGLAGEPAARSACGGDPTALDPVALRPPVTELDAGCKLIDIACLGKVDEDMATAEPETTGCSTGRTPGSALVLLLALALLGRKSTRDR